MAFKLRSSKFRHIYGDAHRKEKCFENVRLTRNAHDSNFCAVNPKFLAVVTESAGGGAFVVLPVTRTGRVDIGAPKVCGHAGNVLDIKWSPFRDNIIASCAEDNTVKVWEIPDGGLLSNLSDWRVDLHGHSRRIGYIEWHPTAENVILSAGFDCKCIIWNIETAEPVNIVSCHEDQIQSISWNRDGSLFATTCKDKLLRIVDPRVGNCVSEAKDLFQGIRPSKCVFLGDTGRVFCTGFNRTGEREIALWDIRNMSADLLRRSLDSSNGILLPYYDHDTKIVFVAGKGDGNIRYFEMTPENPCCHYLNNYASSSPQRGLGVMPKRGCDISKCEVMRFYKLHAARNFVEPISMIVPRKSNVFQDDIFPPTSSAIPSLSADEWISGQNRDPILISMQDQRVVNDPSYIPSNANRPQDETINQMPMITTYRALSGSQHRGSGDTPPVSRSDIQKLPASIKNIKRLSTCEDIVTLDPKSSKIDASKENTRPDIAETHKDKEKAFVNSKIAAFEKNKGNASTGVEVTSPTRKTLQRSCSSNQDPPPDVIANGIKGSGDHRGQGISVHNAAKFFEHKEIEIIDLKHAHSEHGVPAAKGEHSPRSAGVKGDQYNKSLNLKSAQGRLILGEINEDQSKVNLRKAYFQQVKEIKALREQLALKDKRIHQLEDEIVKFRAGSGHASGADESNC
ncbi:coronin-2B-like isoform X2 [Dreissena polymorpha]|uniref:coronin-2B-like isoform X2 n=1 Tax=Dreissena polymorpha TaxID=45954 RepID=UPI002264D6C4|nr:coronin-2B-like isoform X2 [Dreissena polymorpha]